MKLSVFLFLLGIMSVQANEIFSQTSLNIQMKDASVEEVLEKIQMQCNYDFIYDYEYVSELDNVDVDFNSASLDVVLYEILKDSNLDYRLEDEVIILFPREVAKPVSTESNKNEVEQEKKSITGKVTDKDGMSLPGVSVVIKGTNVGVATNIDGEYSLEIEGSSAVLIYSFVGMLPQEIYYTGQIIQNVTLLTDSEQMAEVVVTGYQTISKERASGSFEKVSAKALEDRATLNIIDKLEGQTSGVLFQNGAITIRGASSMNASTSPLIVLDGFPIEGSLESINPNDVESMTILKDAAAASIWGARASNGVIVIVSKKGSGKGKANIEFSSTLSITPEADLYSLRRASTESFLELEKHFADNSWKELASPWAISQPAYNEGLDAYLRYNDGQMTEAEKDAIINRLKGIDVRDEYADLFLRKAVRQQYHLSVNGATEKSNYYASL